MIFVHIFWVFFMTNLLGYGGGPATIPLIQKEVVERYEWMTVQEFNEAFAMGNALPGPIATKMGGYIGFQEGGYLGAALAVLATVAPSLILMITLMGILYKNRTSPRVKRMTSYVKPTIAVLLGVMAFQAFSDAYVQISFLHVLLLAAASYWMMEKARVHPGLVVLCSLLYGAVFLS